MDKPPGSSEFSNLSGCGSSESVTSQITLNISTTTGGNFPVAVNLQNCVDTLKKIISKKLKVAKDRICLLHRERELQEGTLKANGLQDGSKILLIPNVETGLLAQRPENTVMQALESLNDMQVNDFLSGKTPLNLSMRLGDHMMLIQLQLSTINPSPHTITKSRTSSRSSIPTNSSSIIQFKNTDLDSEQNISLATDSVPRTRLSNSESTNISSETTMQTYDEPNMNTFLKKNDLDNFHNIVQNLSKVENPTYFTEPTDSITKLTNIDSLTFTNETNTTKNITLPEHSPIKSLSNLVSSSIKTTSKEISENDNFLKTDNVNTNTNFTDPILANLTSCLCKQLNSNKKQNCIHNNCRTVEDHSSSSILHKIANNTIEKSKNKSQQHCSTSNAIRKNTTNITESKNRGIMNNLKTAACLSNTNKGTEITIRSIEEHQKPVAFDNDKRTLAEASRNLTQTLRKLSKEVFTTKMDFSEDTSKTNSTGAVIESMRKHGKGIYSGTFSGTLNPNLQDRYGRPKRDISTVIHILNDLLSATPHYTRATRISFETPSSPRINKQVSTRNQSTSTTDVCVKCFDSIKVSRHNELQNHNTELSTIELNERNSEILMCHNNNECRSSGKDLCSKSSNMKQKSETDMSNILNDATCINNGIDSVNIGKVEEETYSLNPEKSFCNKCAIELENNKTKCKLEQLKVVMQQRKQRREARKLKDAPYGGRVVSSTTNNVITNLTKPNDVSSKHLAEEVEIMM